MVSALSRTMITQVINRQVKIHSNLPQEEIKQVQSAPLSTQIKELTDSYRSNSKRNFPYALRDFFNSNLDLPSFEELAKNSKELAKHFT